MKPYRHLLHLPISLILAAALPISASAHSALCSCYDNGDETITCEGGFSDGSSAAGVRVFIRKPDNTTLIRGKIDENGEFTFHRPNEKFKVVFDSGPGHQVIIPDEQINE
ncbi:Ig-like domain-containing protein [Desulfogranum japonicum]|uniref:hypothetical protein n=1 Tax=Desulfogranum japonicum TaxID=231447 RepID=UPI00041FCCF8|nr:hypothetical protein [Desulfogranum japonicum]